MRDNSITLTSLRILDFADLVRPVAHMTDTDRYNCATVAFSVIVVPFTKFVHIIY